jgi:hypothetical protein
MKKVMISNGLRGKSDREAYVRQVREAVDRDLLYRNEDATHERLDTFFKDFNGNRLQFLGKSISEGLALADVVYFMDDWHEYDGCVVEHLAAVRYGVAIRYLSSDPV